MTVPSPPISKILTKKPVFGGGQGNNPMMPNLSLSSASSAMSGAPISFSFNTAPVVGNSSNSPTGEGWGLYALLGLGLFVLWKEYK